MKKMMLLVGVIGISACSDLEQGQVLLERAAESVNSAQALVDEVNVLQIGEQLASFEALLREGDMNAALSAGRQLATSVESPMLDRYLDVLELHQLEGMEAVLAELRAMQLDQSLEPVEREVLANLSVLYQQGVGLGSSQAFELVTLAALEQELGSDMANLAAAGLAVMKVSG